MIEAVLLCVTHGITLAIAQPGMRAKAWWHLVFAVSTIPLVRRVGAFVVTFSIVKPFVRTVHVGEILLSAFAVITIPLISDIVQFFITDSIPYVLVGLCVICIARRASA